jgi:hypothetical protein
MPMEMLSALPDIKKSTPPSDAKKHNANVTPSRSLAACLISQDPQQHNRRCSTIPGTSEPFGVSIIELPLD